MASLTIPKSDKGFNINFTVQDSAGSAYDLTDYTVTLKVWSPGVSGTLIVDGACTVDVAADGTCHYTVTASDFTSALMYVAELELTKSGVIESTQNFTLIVERGELVEVITKEAFNQWAEKAGWLPVNEMAHISGLQKTFVTPSGNMIFVIFNLTGNLHSLGNLTPPIPPTPPGLPSLRVG